MLYYTPLLFTSVIVHAHLVNETYIVLLFSLLTPFSVMYHLMCEINHSHVKWIGYIDKCLAYQSVIIPFFYNYYSIQDTMVYLSSLYIPMVYFWNIRYNHGSNPVHATLHIVGTCGIHRLLSLI